jgi:hypothetical protein
MVSGQAASRRQVVLTALLIFKEDIIDKTVR